MATLKKPQFQVDPMEGVATTSPVGVPPQMAQPPQMGTGLWNPDVKQKTPQFVDVPETPIGGSITNPTGKGMTPGAAPPAATPPVISTPPIVPGVLAAPPTAPSAIPPVGPGVVMPPGYGPKDGVTPGQGPQFIDMPPPGPGMPIGPPQGANPGAPPVVPPNQPSALRQGLDAKLPGLFDGGLNNDVVRRRVDSARDVLNKQRSSQTDSLGALLAERGMSNDDGASGTAQQRLEESLGETFAGTVNDIYANEGEAADRRMMDSFGIAGDLTKADQANDTNRFNSQTSRMGVEGSLSNDRNRLGLDTELGRADVGLRGRAQSTNEGRLGLDTKLGEGDLSLRNRSQDQAYEVNKGKLNLDTELGRADVGLRGQAEDTASRRQQSDDTIGRGDLDVRRRGQDQINDLGNRNADINERLGTRGLDLTDQGQKSDFNKFLAQLGFDRDKFNATMQGGDLDRLLEILRQRGFGTGTSTGGTV